MSFHFSVNYLPLSCISNWLMQNFGTTHKGPWQWLDTLWLDCLFLDKGNFPFYCFLIFFFFLSKIRSWVFQVFSTCFTNLYMLYWPIASGHKREGTLCLLILTLVWRGVLSVAQSREIHSKYSTVQRLILVWNDHLYFWFWLDMLLRQLHSYSWLLVLCMSSNRHVVCAKIMVAFICCLYVTIVYT